MNTENFKYQLRIVKQEMQEQIDVTTKLVCLMNKRIKHFEDVHQVRLVVPIKDQYETQRYVSYIRLLKNTERAYFARYFGLPAKILNAIVLHCYSSSGICRKDDPMDALLEINSHYFEDLIQQMSLNCCENKTLGLERK